MRVVLGWFFVDIDLIFLILFMPKTLTIEDKSSLRLYATGLAGAVASLLTQPLEVIKTNRINTPAVLYADLHKTIIRKGWRAYMQGRYLSIYLAQLQSLDKPLGSRCTRRCWRDSNPDFQINFPLSTSSWTTPWAQSPPNCSPWYSKPRSLCSKLEWSAWGQFQ